MKKFLMSFIIFAGLFVLVSFFIPSFASAHCDCIDGPVVGAARKALDDKNVNYALIWVKPEDEEQIRRALRKALAKRKNAKTDKEKNKADLEFFEILVKVHREGEGAPYEGVKPAGTIDYEIALADKAVESKSLDDVLKHIASDENIKIVSHLFHKLMERIDYNIVDINAGREYVSSYATFIHAVESAVKGKDLKNIHHMH